MKKYLVSYATKDFRNSQKKLIKSAIIFGIEKYFSYNPSMIDRKFKKENSEILDMPRGAGYWLWKPYVISEALKKVNEGDLVFYIDSGVEVISDLNPLFDLCTKNNGILLFRTHDYKNKSWIKRDCFVLMDCDNEKFYNEDILAAGYQVYIKNKKSVEFVNDYLVNCQNKNILTDLPNICGKENLKEFIDHRHDQSVLTLLALKNNIKIYRDPSQYGNHYKMKEFRVEGEYLDLGKSYSLNPYLNSPFHTIFYHHRQKIIKVNIVKRVIKKIIRELSRKYSSIYIIKDLK
jgi:hypothetical protein